MRNWSVVTAAALLFLAGAAVAAPPSRTGPEQSPIATSVRVHAGSDIVYISGTVPEVADANAPAGSAERYGNTETQTRSVLNKLEAALAQQGLGLSDIVMMRVFLVAPDGEEQMDFAGMMKAYSGPVTFAGEHLSYQGTWREGAAMSAHKAMKIIQSMSAERSVAA